jgi:MFS family permease
VIGESGWRAAWPGTCATFVAVGIGRFSYTPLVPFLIAGGVLSETEAAYLGAANLLGYLAGAAGAGSLAGRIGMGRSIHLALATAAASLALCVPQLGFWWFLPWRVLIGIASAVLMVLGPSLMLIATRRGERGRAGGLIYAGVGLGTAFGSLIVPPLAARGTRHGHGQALRSPR